ncbi:YbfB/YjiJ family MFS transporter [Solicola gregarius]|uniref:YbfB/YjiJ family MFS transporter n=1 Tax=Solicola gregarius TaxID=2908642 RepID=A0AA46TN98_9ACTN|nr:YbfB/YjiJ family MFS transporter [Solicola gregarius]UYM07493.1 YbfB/YjiJ family MFS transporter [Solicola gregarius]
MQTTLLRPAHQSRWTSAERRLTIGGLLAIGMSFGFARYGYGLFLPEIRREFDLSVSYVGIIGSATYVGYLVALLVVGVYAARVGPRLLVGIGGASAVAGMGLVAVAPNLAILTTGLVLAGTSPAWTWAPYSDAVDMVVARSRRERVLAIVPAGTAIGTAVVGPLALVAHGESWRYAWLAMAATAAAIAVYNVGSVPARNTVSAEPAARPATVGPRWFLRRRAVPLYATAVSYGVVGSFYWNYATAAISDATSGSAATTAMFWTLMGVAGTAGVLAGVLLARLGLRRSSALLFGTLAVAVALLGVMPGSVFAAGVSAILYGPAFMAVSSLLAVWSYQVFPERPTTGFSATLLSLGVGTVAGPAVLGLVAEEHGLRTAFLVTAALAVVTCAVRPARTAAFAD